MNWKIADAKQMFSELVKAAEEEPQWSQCKEQRSLAEAFEDLRRICEEEDLTLEIPPRQERLNPFREP